MAPAPVTVEVVIRQEVLRLLPQVAIGSAWRSRALINAQAVLWAQTTDTRELPAVTVVGRRVQVRIAFERASWTFGDGASDTSAVPGKPYDQAHDPCRTAQCPHYYGHTYTQLGHRTITLRVAWRARFSLDGRTWRDIPQSVAGPAERRDLDVVEARGILVPD
ncbi:MAG: hypothetical protein J0H43_10210 [Actinobacteria bacterium]|nr:hypothetical protein [Actinomycetota bacterium]